MRYVANFFTTTVNSLEMAQKLVETENIEFYVLVDRLQDINRRLEKDTAKLLEQKEKEDANIEEHNRSLRDVRGRNLEKRRNAKVKKEDWLGQKAAAIQTTENQRTDADANIKALRAKYEPLIDAKNLQISKLKAEKEELQEFITEEEKIIEEKDVH